MKHIDKIIVSIQQQGKEINVGELVLNNNKIYFKYYLSFIEKDIEISPFHLPLTDKIITANVKPFEGLFGVFNDSLPDGWGRLLLDRALISKDINLNQITPLDRLSYLGSNGMGALTYKPKTKTNLEFDKKIELDYLHIQMQNVLNNDDIDDIDELFQLGGSSGGARPKIFVGYNPVTNYLIPNQENLPNSYEHWIIKFSNSNDFIDIANIEYAYYKMALDAGIIMSTSKIFKGKSGKQYFGTKRFDRRDGNRIHMHSAAGLLNDDFRLSSLDYGHLMDCAFQLEKHIHAYEKVLRLAAFNVYAHNRDDHSKNFSFLMNQNGTWQLAPAYDLTFSNSSHGMHSTTIAGEGTTPGRKQLLKLAHNFGVKNGNEIIDEVQAVISKWDIYASQNDVSKKSIKLISKILKGLKD